MDYIMRVCPKCKKELPVPANLTECICMYCGEPFRIREQAAGKEEVEEVGEIEIAYQEALEQMSALVEDYEALLQKFTKEWYQTCFLEYARLGATILSPINRYAALSQELRSKALDATSEKLMDALERNIKADQGILIKKSKAILIDQNRYFLAVYLVPMLQYLQLELGDALTDRIMEDWTKRYPKSAFKKATYEELEAGFMRKGFCFITSAVCDSQNKPDNCYELERFRGYRDQFLMSNEEGRKLVEEYYNRAPRIVTYLNMQVDCEERYQRIWHQYLQPCLLDIEEGRMLQCQERYVRMVRDLNSQLPF